MALKLKELDSFLSTGKMQFEPRKEGPHIGYVVRFDGRRLGLPTLLRVSHGAGDADFGNLKGVAAALGLNVRELETAEACRIRRECILIMLAVHMLQFALQRYAMLRDKETGLEGVKAMVESVGCVLKVLEGLGEITWKVDELKALNRIRPNVERLSGNPLVVNSSKALLSRIAPT